METSGDGFLIPQFLIDGPDSCVGSSNGEESKMKRIVGSLWQTGSPFLYMVLGAGAPRTDWFDRNDNLMVSAGLGTRVRLGGPYIDIDVSAEQHLGKDLEALYQAGLDHDKDALLSYIKPYPAVRLSLGLPLGRSLHLTGGVKTLIQLEEGGLVPESQKTQDTITATWFGVPFTAWSQWFVGAKVRR